MLTVAELDKIIHECKYMDWNFDLCFFDLMDLKYPYLQVTFWAPDLTTKKLELQKSRKWVLSYHMTKSEVVSTVLKAVMTALEHEARETFKYKDKAIFGPHFDVDWLTKSPQFDVREKPLSEVAG
jgi:hypothetical protein